MKLYIGNLPWKVDDNGLKEMFASYGADEANVISDKFSGRSKGFGFVTIADDEAANKAISEMNEKKLKADQLRLAKQSQWFHEIMLHEQNLANQAKLQQQTQTLLINPKILNKSESQIFYFYFKISNPLKEHFPRT